MKWDLLIPHQPKQLRLKAERILATNRFQRIRVSGKNRSILLENNYPLRKMGGSGAPTIQWKLLEGTVSDPSLLAGIITELERVITNGESEE